MTLLPGWSSRSAQRSKSGPRARLGARRRGPLWLAQVEARANAGSLAFSTDEAHETTARMILIPARRRVGFDQFTVGRCNRILQRILQKQTVSKAWRPGQ